MCGGGETESLPGDQRTELSGRPTEQRSGYVRPSASHPAPVGHRASTVPPGDFTVGRDRVRARRSGARRAAADAAPGGVIIPARKRDTEGGETARGSRRSTGASGPDAVHIAAAAVSQCDYLLTWNFRHIANVKIRSHVEGFSNAMATRKRESARPNNSCRKESDQVLAEVYAVRDRYAAEHGYDLDRLFADLKRREAEAASSRPRKAR